MTYFNEKDFNYEEIDDSLIVLRTATQDVFLLNSTSKHIMLGLLQQQNITHIIDEYCSNNPNINRNIIYKDFIDIKNTLFEKGILYER